MIEKYKNVTFVVIGLNEALTLDKCFKSIQSITHNIIYVDSNSTDDSVKIAKENNIKKVIRLKSNYYSATLSRFVGANYVKTKYIQFLDGDMAIDKDWMEIAINKLEFDMNIAAVLGYRKEYNKNFEDYYLFKDAKEREPDYMGGAFCINTEKYREVGGFDLILPAEEERDLYVRIKHHGYKVKYLHTLMASHFNFKSQDRTLLYSIFSFRSSSIFLPLINSIKNNTFPSWVFVYKKSIPTLIIDILTLLIFIFMLFGVLNITVSILIALIAQVISVIYSIKIKRKGYFIIWKSGLLGIFKMIKIMKRDVEYTIEEIK